MSTRPAKIERFLDRDIWIARMLASDLSSPATRVATALALHLNIKRSLLQVSIPTLAAGTGYHERHIRRLLADIERSGWISIKRSLGRVHSFHLMEVEPRTSDVQGTPPDILEGYPGHLGNEPRTSDVLQNSVTAEQREREHGTPARALARCPVPKNEKEMAWAALRDVWTRPWADDQQADRTAFEKACKVAAPEDILAGAKEWAATVEARYLPSLAKWLTARSWEKPPPKRPKKQRGNGKVDVVKTMLKQVGWIEDDEGNLYDPEREGLR
jgi:hypothetical protein